MYIGDTIKESFYMNKTVYYVLQWSGLCNKSEAISPWDMECRKLPSNGK